MAVNRLIKEKSPYLLQHAHDPVDWWPWCPQAFETALREDRPVLLSIGYSTCHWCHVMGREAFSDPAVAEVLNRAFVPIKVDREERPDVDAVYMRACHALTGSGGWPLTVLAGPDQKPFWAGTYLPARSGWGQVGLLEVLERVEALWREDRQSLLDAGQAVTDRVAAEIALSPADPDMGLPRAAAGQLLRRFDPAAGGFGGAPKFPMPQNILFLLAYARLEGDERALEMADRTLEGMIRGGIHDQIGGGFCRYATDKEWRVPHFEKLLGDNALLACACLAGWEETGRRIYEDAARRTLDYLLEELRLPGGAFATGQDADAGGEEGRFYRLTPGELARVLGEREAGDFCRWYGITWDSGVPALLDNPDWETPDGELEAWREKVRLWRRGRMALHRDDKVLTSWNGLAIAALARAGRALGERRYWRAAESARLFLKTRLTTPEGRLMLRWREREAAQLGQLEDYAFYLWGLLELYEVNFSASVLREACTVADWLLADFEDGERGGFYHTAHSGERLIARPKEAPDGALPSGNAAAGLALGRLGRLTGRQKYREAARRQLRWLAGQLQTYPAGGCFSMLALLEELSPGQELLAAAPEVPRELEGLPEQVQTVVKTPANARALARLAPFTAAAPIPAEGAAYYLCRDGACRAPVRSLSELPLRRTRRLSAPAGGR